MRICCCFFPVICLLHEPHVVAKPQDAVLAIRALRKLLGSLNPIVRCGKRDYDTGRARHVLVV